MNLPTPPDTPEDDWLLDDDDVKKSAHDIPVDERPWRVLIVDDDLDVHAVTRLALRNVSFKGRELELVSAYSGEEAFSILRDAKDFALVLLDVVMETDDAGLRLVGRIRGELGNQLVRIVLRTGQPGQAPEQRVIIEYDINDYKAKTELTTQKLFTTVIASLRAYESLLMIERSRIGLWKILEGATNLYRIRSLREFSSGVLNQVSAILDVGADGVLCVLKGNGKKEHPALTVIAATGRYADLAETNSVPDDHYLSKSIAKAFREKHSQYEHPVDVMYIKTQEGEEFTISVTPPWPLGEVQRNLLEVFCDRIAAALDNFYLFDQLHKTQEATITALANLAEFRDERTGDHVRRVRRLTQAIAEKLHERGIYKDELTPELFEMIGIASILHDVGKVNTPDQIQMKPAPHTSEERDLMRAHALVGEGILERASKMVAGPSYLSFGAQIAGGHHERFDGTGYPRGLAGFNIPLAARIVAVVDVCDALLHRRPFKEAWPFSGMKEYMQERRGTQFDPEIVDALFDVLGCNAPDWLISDE